MPIYRINEQRVLFIHIPKTGGTSVESFLRDYSPEGMHNQGNKIVRPVSGTLFSSSVPLQHFHARLLEAVFPENFFDYAFMIVRDPVARAVSAYRHSRALGRPEGRLSFSHWLRLMLPVTRKLPYVRNNHMRAQTEFECFGAKVFHFEAGMPQILSQIANDLGLPAPEDVPHKRRIEGDVPEVSEADRALIKAHYERDFIAYSY
jgi:hypothetical protein